MAVGTIASLKVSNLTTTSFDVTFTKPANVTKIRWQMVPTDGSLSIGGKDLTRAVTGTTGSTKVEHFSGLSPNKKYYLYAIPYNGSEQGTTKQYTHSGASPVNSITMGKSIPAPTTPATSTTGYNPLSGIVAQTQSGGKTTNNATSSTGSGAGGNTPQPGTTDPAPNDLNNPSRETIQIEKLETKHTYAIFVRSKATTVDGKTITSPWSLPIHVNTPAYSASGNNFASKNSNGDIQLDGGSLYAGEFPINAGQINVVTDNPDAKGVVLNQTGLAGFNVDGKTFYIDSSTGDAWFKGEISSSSTIGGTNISSYINTSAATVAQTAANGKNTIRYGGRSGSGLNGVPVSTTSGFAPDGNVYYTSGSTPTFPLTISYGYTNQQSGDTFFSFNLIGNIIFQYTATSSSSWSMTQISSQVISELDVGKLTAGTINVAISLTSASIYSGYIEGGSIVAGTFSTNTTTSTGITNAGVPRFLISPTIVSNGWESSTSSMRIVLDPGVTTSQDTSGFFEVVGNSSGKGWVNLIAPYNSSNTRTDKGVAGFKIVSGSGNAVGTIYAYGAIYTTASALAGNTLSGLRRSYMTTTSYNQNDTAPSGTSDGDIILVYTA